MGSSEGRKKIWTGAIFLAIAAFFGKILSALYRIPYQNITGDLGYYVYQQIYPFYGAAMVVAMYGFPVLISKMVAEEKKKAGRKAALEMVWSAFFILLIIHVTLFIVFFSGASFIAEWMGDARLAAPLRVVGAVFLFIPFYSAIRGYFQGTNEMSPTALSHLIEQFVRVTAIVAFAWFVIRSGKDAYAAGEAAAWGSLFGACAGVLFLVMYVWLKGYLSSRVRWRKIAAGVKKYKKVVLIQGWLLCIGSMVLILYQVIDAFSIAKILTKTGVAAQEAREVKGLFDRGQPLLQFGTVVALSIAMTVVPLISLEEKNENRKRSRRYARLAVRVSVLIGSAAAVGLLIIAEPVNIFLYGNNDGTVILRILALTLAVSGPVMVTSAVMQGHDCFVKPALHMLAGWGVKLLGNVIFLPLYGVTGAAVATFLGMCVTAVCNIGYLSHKRWIYLPSFTWLAKAFLGLAGMGVVTSLLYYVSVICLPTSRITAAASAVGVAIMSALIFIWFIIRLNLFTRKERSLLPVFEKLEGWRRKEK